MLEHKSGNISETHKDRGKDRGKVTMEALQEFTNALSNGIILDLLWPALSQDWGFATPTQNCSHYYLWTSNLDGTFTGSICLQKREHGRTRGLPIF